MKKIALGQWDEVARLLLPHTANPVDSEVMETDEKMQEFDLVVRILGEDGRVVDRDPKIPASQGKKVRARPGGHWYRNIIYWSYVGGGHTISILQ